MYRACAEATRKFLDRMIEYRREHRVEHKKFKRRAKRTKDKVSRIREENPEVANQFLRDEPLKPVSSQLGYFPIELDIASEWASRILGTSAGSIACKSLAGELEGRFPLAFQMFTYKEGAGILAQVVALVARLTETDMPSPREMMLLAIISGIQPPTTLSGVEKNALKPEYRIRRWRDWVKKAKASWKTRRLDYPVIDFEETDCNE